MRPRNMFRVATAALVVGVCVSVLSACETKPMRYVDLVFSATTKSTERFQTTTDLNSGSPLDLYTDIYQPSGDKLAKRPVIVWIHGGGFKDGDRSSMGSVAAQWARRGYVTLSISYRLDPGNRCMEVQYGSISNPSEEATERARCFRAITAARNDALASVAWVRKHAARLRVDTSRIAVGGSSAGAISAVNVGQQANANGGAVPAQHKVGAVLAMSGCQYDLDRVDARDAPLAMVASGHDGAVFYSCSVATVNKAKSFGTATMSHYYPNESGHALDLYRHHQAEVDKGWTLFLYQHLKLSQPA
ncbi:MAG: alpha/beta hydrolase [Acidimicrobiales bacterium]|nr:alpha/beta hydrolase [Acidimicrobiales bacterium]